MLSKINLLSKLPKGIGLSVQIVSGPSSAPSAVEVVEMSKDCLLNT